MGWIVKRARDVGADVWKLGGARAGAAEKGEEYVNWGDGHAAADSVGI